MIMRGKEAKFINLNLEKLFYCKLSTKQLPQIILVDIFFVIPGNYFSSHVHSSLGCLNRSFKDETNELPRNQFGSVSA
jgi:hypothetical protein